MSEAATATRWCDPAERRRATCQDVLDAPLHRVAEVVDGVLLTNRRPAMRHAHASSSLGAKIGADRTLETFELREAEWVLIATAQDDAPVRIRPFDAVTLSLGLWPSKGAPAEWKGPEKCSTRMRLPGG